MKNGFIISILSVFRGVNSLPRLARFFIYLIVILSSSAAVVSSYKTEEIDNKITELTYAPQNGKQILGETTQNSKGAFTINIPSYFNSDTQFKGNATFDGTATFNGDIVLKTTKLDLGTGQILASNIIYGLTAGDGIGITTGQTPTITNSGVTSLQGSTGAVTLTAGSGITINGTTISSSNSTSQPNTFGTFTVGGSSVSAGSTTDTFTFASGTGITLGLNTSTKTLTISGNNSGATAWTDDGNYTYLTTSSESVGIGTSVPSAKLDVQGSINITGTTKLNGVTYTWPAADGSNGYLLATNASGGLSWVSNSGSTNYWQLISGGISPAQITNDLLIGGNATNSAFAKFSGTSGGNSFVNTGNFGIGSTTPGYKLDVNGDINIASGSTLKIAGTTVLSGNTLGSGITGSSLTSVGTIGVGVWQGTLISSQYGGTGANLSAAAQGALPYFSATGVMSALAAGTSSQCLIGGTTPSWGSCGGTAWITQLNGALVPINSTLDFLIGGQATSSAKFAVLNIANGTPTASVSAGTTGSLYITADGKIATTAKQGLVLGDSTTTGDVTIGGSGLIAFAPAGSTAMTLTTGGNLGIGTTTPGGLLHVNPNNGAFYSGFEDNSLGAFVSVSATPWTTTSSQSYSGTYSVRSGAIGSSSSTTMTLTRTIPVGTTISFAYKVQSENGFDKLYFYIDGVEQNNWSGDTGWATASFSVTSGTHTFTWTYSKDNAVNVGLDAAFIDDVTIGTPAVSSLLVDGNGNVGIGTTSVPTAFVVATAVPGKALSIFNYTGSDQNILVGSKSGTLKFAFDSNGNLSLGGSAPSSSNYLTAPNFILNTSGQITTGIWQGTAVTTTYGGTGLGSYSAGDLLYYASGTTLSKLGIGSNGTCLTSNGSTPSWGSCGSNYWQLANGVVSPFSSTLDFALGGTSTSSAKFAVLNMAGGTPAASISGGLNGTNGITFGADGTIQALQNITLTIGGNTTGNLILKSDNSTVFQTPGTENTFVGKGAGAYVSSLTDVTALGYNSCNAINASGASFSTCIGSKAGDHITSGADNTFLGYAAGTSTSNGSFNIMIGKNTTGSSGLNSSIGIGYKATITASNQFVLGSNDSNGSITDAYLGQGVTKSSPAGITLNATGGTGTDNAGAPLTIAGGKGTGTGLGGNLVFKTAPAGTSTGSSANALATRMTIYSNGNIGIGTTTNDAFVNIYGGSTAGNAVLVVNQTGASSNDIFSASASGTTKFTIANNGNISATGTLTGLTGLSLSSGSITLGGVTGSGLCLTGGATASWGSCGATGTNYLTNYSGALANINSTMDLLIGGQATTSAKFAVLNIAGGTPRASVSGDFIVMPNSGTGSAGGGNVGIGTTAPSAGLEISTNGGLNKPGLLISGSWLTDGSGNTVNHRPQFLISDPNVVNGFWDVNGTGFGMNAPNGFTGTLVQLNSNGTGKFSIAGDGNITATGTLTGLTGLTLSSGAINVGSTNGTSSQCLLGGSTASWGSCGSAPFSILNGAYVPGNTTADFLIGATATSSAKFSVLNMAGTGTPTASVSGNMIIMPNAGSGGMFGIGTTSPAVALDVVSRGAAVGGFNLSGNSLSTGTLANFTSTSTALSSGGLLALDWSPGSATTATGDLLSLNVGSNGVIGNFFNIKNAGSSVFSVSQTQVTTSLPTSFTAAGDVSIAYDINFTNPTASYIKSAAPLYFQSGDLVNSYDLTLRSFNAGQVITDAAGGVYLAGGYGGGNAAVIIDQLGPVTNDIFSASASGTTRFVIDNRGNVGIGTTLPKGLLQITGATPTSGNALVLFNQTNTNSDIFTASSAGTTKFTINKSGDVTIVGSTTTCTLGNGAGTTACSSDERLKENINTLGSSLDSIMALHPVTFTWKDKNKPQNTNIGFIAQEVQRQFPQFVRPLGDGYLGLDYSALVVPAIKAIQEQQGEIEIIKNNLGIQTGSTSAVLQSDLASLNVSVNQVTLDVKDIKEKQITGETEIAGLTFTLNDQETTLASHAALLSQVFGKSEENSTAIASLSAKLDKLGAFNFINSDASTSGDIVTIQDGLLVLGSATLNEASIATDIIIGNTLKIDSSSLNTIGQDLDIQSLRQGAISFMAGAVKIETDGTVRFMENVAFEKNVSVAGVLGAKSINLTRDTYQDLSDIESLASASAGTTTITAGKTKRILRNNLIKTDSLIYVTPIGKTFGQTPYISDQEDGQITITIDSTVSSDVKLNFLIINTEDKNATQSANLTFNP